MNLHVSSIQRMCFDDGAGIRTTLFCQGCLLRCPWCCNPETQRVVDDSQNSFTNTFQIQDVEEEVLKDCCFWEGGGGITFSGGEPLLQAQSLKELCVALKKRNVNIVVETSLFGPIDNVKNLFPFVDLWYVDIKILQPEICRSVLGGNINEYMKNVRFLHKHGGNISFRIPCSTEYTICKENWGLIIDFLSEYNEYPVEIFSVHNLAKNKYQQRSMDYTDFEIVTDDKLTALCEQLTIRGLVASIMTV